MAMYDEAVRALRRAGFNVHVVKVFNVETNYMDWNVALERKKPIINPDEYLIYTDTEMVSYSGVVHKLRSTYMSEEWRDTLVMVTMCDKRPRHHNYRPGWLKVDKIPSKYRKCKHCYR